MMIKKTNVHRTKRRGRPSRESASKRALRGIDTSRCDPRQVLREVALDYSQPGSARVSAARALAELDAIEQAALKSLHANARPSQDGQAAAGEDEDSEEREAIVADALALLRPN